MANVALSQVHPQLRLLRFGVVLVAVAAVTLAIVGATNQIAITVIPALAGLTGFGIEEYSLNRTEHGRAPLHHRLRAGVVGAVVFVAAVVIASAT
jgi:hypothetical protein